MFFLELLKIREEEGRVKEKFEEMIMKCGENLQDQVGLAGNREEKKEEELLCRKSHGSVGYKVRIESFFCLFVFYILRHESEGIVWWDRRRVEGKVEKIQTDRNKEKIQINTIVHVDKRTSRPRGNPI